MEEERCDEIEYTQSNAKVEYEKGNYSLACNIYEKLWEESYKNNMFLLSWYGRTLRKLNDNQKYIDICDELDESSPYKKNKYVMDILCWCIYDVCIKDYLVENQDEFNVFINRAVFIVNNSYQLSSEKTFINPYVLTIMKVVKIYNKRASVRYKSIVEWLSYLNPDNLSEEVYSYVDNSGKGRELASPKEFYFQNMAKALEKTEDYIRCIEICEKAFVHIKKFHYRNDIWLKARMHFSKCMSQDDTEIAIKEYQELAEKENFWFMYHKLSNICFRYNKIPDALFFACKAFGTRFEYEKMVNLFFDTALLWQAVGDSEKAKVFFHASAYYRKRSGWSMPEELKYAIIEFNMDVDKKPNIMLLQKIAKTYVESIEGLNKLLKGTILNILPHGGAGFISPEREGKNIYFSKRDIKYKHFLAGDKVEFELKNSTDGRIQAVEIKKRG